MSVIIPESQLPHELTAEQAVEAAYSNELAEVASKLTRNLPCLIEADKDVAPFLYLNVRNRLRAVQPPMRCLYLDGRPRQDEQPGAMPMGMMGTMIAQLREAVRGAVERRVVVLPHLDLLTTSQGGLTAEAREVIPLLYENPELVWLGFKDPSFPLPRVIENLFPHRISLLGIGRNRLQHLITQRESRKFGREFNPWQLYKHVSGVNAVRLRRLLSTLEGEDYPANPHRAYRQLRQATLTGTLEVPNIDFDRDIGGYATVKKQLRSEILDVLTRKDQLVDAEEIQRMEELIPKGMIFWGPPGTGKTLFAKGMAASLGAAITVVSGPELKSKWVGESLAFDEEVFVILNGQARRIPIGELVEEHAHEEVHTWTVLDDGSARLAPVTGFLRHDGPDYIDVLITETGREVRVTGGHSLFVEKDGQLSEVFAEEVEPGKTRIAVPLRLAAPECVHDLDLAEALGTSEAVHVHGGDALVEQAVACLEAETAELAGIPIQRYRHKHRPRITLGAFRRLAAAARLVPDSSVLSLSGLRAGKTLPARLPLTEDLGVFLGKWVANGCIAETGVRLACHEKEVPYYEALCQQLFGHVTVYRKKGGRQLGVDLIINSLLLRRVMREGWQLQDGSGNKRVPAFIFLAPRPVVAAFLRGYFSGDGTFNGKYIEATTVSRGLANDILTLLQYFAIAARCRTRREWNGSVSYRIRFIWIEFLRRFVNEIGFVEVERNRAVRDYIDNIRLKRDVQTPRGHITNDVLWDLVVEKRREPYAHPHVYDLSVPGTERFIAGFGNVLVHNSEENLRQLFHKARQSAPAIIVFDELDSFASARGTYTGSGVEHSMVNQLLTEMDGFRKEDLVFVIGTTNFVEILDPALLRPGRFEFHLHVPYPDNDDRKAILQIYDKKMHLQMSEEALEYAVRRTGRGYATATGTPFSGDHLNAMCRAVARIRIREDRKDATTPQDVERGLTEYDEKWDLSAREERLLAIHESGHAVVSLFCPLYPPIERITIKSEMAWAPGYTAHQQDTSMRIGQTREQLMEDLCVLFGGIEAERLLSDDVSTGAAGSDLVRATNTARFMVEFAGMGGETGLRQFSHTVEGGLRRSPELSEEQRAAIDRAVNALISEAQSRAATILRENRAILETLRDLLLERKSLDAKSLKELAGIEKKKTDESPRKHETPRKTSKAKE